MKESLLELAKKYDTDKVGHGYMPIYEKHLPEKVTSFLEIGTWHGAGIRTFKEWYNNEGVFSVMDIFGGDVITPVALQELGINSYIGSQGDYPFISSIKEKFDVITEDGSHHSDEQITTFKQLFIHNVNDGGVYFMEDVHCCTNSYWWRGIISRFEDTALYIFKQLELGGDLTSQLITAEENEVLKSMISSVEVFNDSMVIIHKK